MEFERLGEVWRGTLVPGSAPGDLGPLLDRLQALERSVRRRDRRESFVAVALLPLVAWVAITGPSATARLGALVIVLASVLIPIRLRSARRPPSDRGEPIAAALRLELERIRAQESLLRGVLWWYLGPLGLGVGLIIVGSVASAWAALGLVAVVAWLYWQIWRLNQRAVERELQPRVRELVAWLASLEESSGTSAIRGGRPE